MSTLTKTSSFGKRTVQTANVSPIEQRVEITADFPGVTEAIEIKHALEQLADNAYQAVNIYKY
jgi:hypothetical protein